MRYNPDPISKYIDPVFKFNNQSSHLTSHESEE